MVYSFCRTLADLSQEKIDDSIQKLHNTPGNIEGIIYQFQDGYRFIPLYGTVYLLISDRADGKFSLSSGDEESAFFIGTYGSWRELIKNVRAAINLFNPTMLKKWGTKHKI